MGQTINIFRTYKVKGDLKKTYFCLKYIIHNVDKEWRKVSLNRRLIARIYKE